MKRKFLEDLGLEKDVIDKIMAENGADIEAEKAKTTDATNKLEDATKQLEGANNTIKDLKKNNSDNEELQNKVKEYEDNIKTQKSDYDAKIRNLTLDGAIEKALAGAKAKHSDLLSSKIDREKLIIGEDGKVVGLDEQLSGLKESYKDLFETTIAGISPINNEILGGGGVTKEQFSKMGYKDRVNLYNTNKDLYDQLSKE